jgi:Cof subfamily protein (haloacid dehalogenase superfamily)
VGPREWRPGDDAPAGRPGLIAADLDGTLLPYSLVVPDGMAAAIAAVRAAGIVFVICTGRMFRSVRRVAGQLGLRDGPVVCYQGAMVCDLASGERLLHRPIEREVAAEVVRHLRDLGRHLNAYIDDELCVDEVDTWARRYAEAAEVGITETDDLEAAVLAREPTKFVVLSEADDLDRLAPELARHWRGRLRVTRSQPNYLELVDPRVSKSGTLEWLCARMALDAAASVACGDAENDVDMLRWAGTGVAMAAAAPGVRAAADVVVRQEELPALLLALADARS